MCIVTNYSAGPVTAKFRFPTIQINFRAIHPQSLINNSITEQQLDNSFNLHINNSMNN